MADFSSVRHDSLVRYLTRHLAGEVRSDETSRRLYSTDASLYQVQPLGVVLPKTVDDLTATVQIAAELGVPITARGGGTSLSGQSIGPGIVIDCSKYLNQIGEVDVTNRTVRVQPGVVLDQLNRALSPQGLQFGPDVATASRATLGGMIGNNSAGSRSVVYGKTDDHVKALSVVLADGTRAEIAPQSGREYQRLLEARTRVGDVYRLAERIARDHAPEIDQRFPKILRRVSGYNLPSLVANPASLVQLLVGSEGTLAVMAEAELKLVPKPAYRGLVIPHFDRLQAALDAVAACLEFQPSAVELLDQMLIDLARDQRALRRHMAAVQGRPAALLMVEFSGESEAEIADRAEKLTRRLNGIPGLTAIVPALTAALRDPIWDLRRASMPLLYSLPGNRKPVTFVEDCAVAPEKMPEFAARFREILRRHGTDGAFYGHASVGCLHIRPVLDLHDPADVRTMRALTTDVTDLVLEFHGALSGEHGDGMVRSEWNEKMYGPVVYDLFRQVKAAFDPEGVLNPGRVVNGPPMDESLRVPPGLDIPEPTTVFDYSGQGGFFKSIEVCNGAGVCRKTQGGTMCPSYRATRDEQDSTRGRANALRLALVPENGSPSAPSIGQRWLAPVMDLCLSCKACKTECPSNVDLAKLKAEYLQAYYEGRPRPLGHLLVKNIDELSPLAASFAGIGNWLGRRPFVRGILESIAGIDRRRSLPDFHRDHFRRWFRRHQRSRGLLPSPRGRVMLLDDCFTTFQEPEIGRATVQLLERAGYEVDLASVCCGRAMISKGFLTAARHLARNALPRLARAAADGIPILGLEPSCLLTLTDEWTELIPGPATRQVAAKAELAEAWLARQIQEEQVPLTFRPSTTPLVFHGHCHQKALVGVGGTTSALGLIPNSKVTVLDAGCCGMAGSFGYEKKHYDLSVKIANLALIPGLSAAPEATVIATGTSCRHQIRDLTGRTAKHPIEVLAENSERPA